MPLTITVPDEIVQSVDEIARASGTAREKLLIDALRVQFAPVPDDLAGEFAMWDRASDEDFAKFIGELERD